MVILILLEITVFITLLSATTLTSQEAPAEEDCTKIFRISSSITVFPESKPFTVIDPEIPEMPPPPEPPPP